MGMIRVAKTLIEAGCNYFYVANLDEGIELRKEIISKDEFLKILENKILEHHILSI